MRRFALLLALPLLTYGVSPASAANKFHIGSRPTSGRVRFQVNGGAGRHPQFRIGGVNKAGYHHLGANYVSSGVPVAVGGGYGCCGNYFGDGGFSNLYNQGFIPVPPYFALHPPVYYSVPVPRTYGYSPFAYPGGVPTPDVELGPEEIINPHVVPEEAPEPAQETSNQTAAAPLVIRNPFVEQAQVVGFTADAR